MDRERERRPWDCEELEVGKTEDRGDLCERGKGQQEAGGKKSGMNFIHWLPRPEDTRFSCLGHISHDTLVCTCTQTHSLYCFESRSHAVLGTQGR